jgi:elongation factor 1-gamma
MALQLLVDQGNFRAFKILIAAEYNSVAIDIPEFKASDNKTAEFLAKSPLGRVPVLVTPAGSIFESNAIARYVARMRRDTELFGVSFFESALVDSWIDFSAHNIELPATLWFYPVLGYIPYNAIATAKAKTDLAKALTVLEKHLQDKTYLVGHKITLADIAVVSALVYPFKFVADAAFRAPFPNVLRWFETCVNQPAFEAVVGTVVLAEKELTASGAAIVPFAAPAAAAAGAAKVYPVKEKKEKAPKAAKVVEEKKPKEKKPKDDEEEEEPSYQEKKAEHPFKLLDKSNPTTFVMDTWKKTYSNCNGDYHGAMDAFWASFDPTGWTIFRGDYKYNEENRMLFMSGNLIGGFIQRTEEIRKWLFGTMTIRGVEGTQMKITAYYLIRGDSIQPLISCNDDADCYTWTKLEIPASPESKAMLYDYWCSEGDLEGEPNLDSRCYK